MRDCRALHLFKYPLVGSEPIQGLVTGTLGSGGATFILWRESRWEGAGRRVNPGQGQSCSVGTECECMLEQGDKLFELQSSLVTWLRSGEQNARKNPSEEPLRVEVLPGGRAAPVALFPIQSCPSVG